jgi:tripartite-type tricarboxylate transporter receptor subunit TctC
VIRRLIPMLAALAFAAGAAHAQYAQKPVRIIVPFAAGGSTDIFARLIGERLSVALAQPVIVENRPGASGNIGAETVARAAPDGYTLLMATTGVMSINNALFKNMTFDAATDFDYVIMVASITNMLVVGEGSPFRNVGDIVAAAKRAPGTLTFASSGAGSSTHMSSELLKMMAGIDMVHVPYKGSGVAMPDVITGRVSMMIDQVPGAIENVRAGKLRAIAVTAARRSDALPDVPTVSESGVPGYESLSWSGIAVPAGTPREIVLRLNREINAILDAPDMRRKLAEQGAEATGGTPEAFADHARREREKWSRVVRESAITLN